MNFRQLATQAMPTAVISDEQLEQYSNLLLNYYLNEFCENVNKVVVERCAITCELAGEHEMAKLLRETK